MTFLVVVLALVIACLMTFMIGACLRHQRMTGAALKAMMDVISAMNPPKPNGNGGSAN